MKKIINLIFSLALCFTACNLSLITIYPSSSQVSLLSDSANPSNIITGPMTYEGSKPLDYKTYDITDINIKTYFQNLKNYAPLNPNGSCGYVSLIECLTYYDTFYNDNIVPEKYERKTGDVDNFYDAIIESPGVKRSVYPPEGDNLYNHIEQQKEEDYQMYLMSIGNSVLGREPKNYSPEIGMVEYNKILDKLLPSSEVSYSYKEASDFGIFADYKSEKAIQGFDSYVKDIIDSGHPAILHIMNYNYEKEAYEYHAVVAYYYDSKGIHANFGYGDSRNDSVLSDRCYIKEAGVLDFSNLEETHSSNYSVNGVLYCGCGHSHKHSYTEYTYYNNSLHVECCSCGKVGTKKSPHIASGIGTNKNCIKCHHRLSNSNNSLLKSVH